MGNYASSTAIEQSIYFFGKPNHKQTISTATSGSDGNDGGDGNSWRNGNDGNVRAAKPQSGEAGAARVDLATRTFLQKLGFIW